MLSTRTICLSKYWLGSDFDATLVLSRLPIPVTIAQEIGGGHETNNFNCGSSDIRSYGGARSKRRGAAATHESAFLDPSSTGGRLSHD
jgi:hypothetical protein